MLICSMTMITPCVLFCEQQDHLRVFHYHYVRVLKSDGQIVTAAVWHMRSALLAGYTM